ncbi:hypothetical protein BKG82_13080 [Mycobacteroides chelonae]|uniref:Uncharacterized protein n=1 Tax=Mycobacteroides chelonae TaxID=1774 RepID=A0A1S1LS57_MYCCH|nr:hypothetical protein BKG82_13080 [Mycobacteroides chelonae]
MLMNRVVTATLAASAAADAISQGPYRFTSAHQASGGSVKKLGRSVVRPSRSIHGDRRAPDFGNARQITGIDSTITVSAAAAPSAVPINARLMRNIHCASLFTI